MNAEGKSLSLNLEKLQNTLQKYQKMFSQRICSIEALTKSIWLLSWIVQVFLLVKIHLGYIQQKQMLLRKKSLVNRKCKALQWLQSYPSKKSWGADWKKFRGGGMAYRVTVISSKSSKTVSRESFSSVIQKINIKIEHLHPNWQNIYPVVLIENWRNV